MKMRSSTVTTFAADAHIRGDLKLGGNLVNHGRVEGQGVVGGILTIGPRGVWDGDVEARYVYVDGLITGSVTASEQIVVGPRGCIQGWVRTARLKIHEGGQVAGELLVGKAMVHPIPRPRAHDGGAGESMETAQARRA